MSSFDQASGASNAGLVRGFIEQVWNGEAEPEAFLTADYMDHAYATKDVGGLKKALGELRTAFPDQRSEVLDVVASGDRVGMRLRLRGTHLGAFRGAEPTGAPIDVNVYRWFRLADGRIAEHWALLDTAALLRQVGLR